MYSPVSGRRGPHAARRFPKEKFLQQTLNAAPDRPLNFLRKSKLVGGGFLVAALALAGPAAAGPVPASAAGGEQRVVAVGKSGPFQITLSNTDKDNGKDWRAQYLMRRHHVSASLCGLIAAIHYGEVCDAA